MLSFVIGHLNERGARSVTGLFSFGLFDIYYLGLASS